jgi:cytochrome c-type biogenesis protein CcsB
MKVISKILFSMETMGFLILTFAAAIGVATFIENDFGTQASKAVVYNAWWFNLLMVWLMANLVANIFRYKLYRLQKLPVFLFHVAFLVIGLGAGITRFISYEGMMHIREGDQSNIVVSDNTYVQVWMNEGEDKAYSEDKVMPSVLTPHAYSNTMDIGQKKVRFKTTKYVPNAREVVVESAEGGFPFMVLVSSSGMGRQNFYFQYGTKKNLGTFDVNFSENLVEGAVNVRVLDGNLQINPPDTVVTMSMMGGANDTILPGSWFEFTQRKLYQMNGLNLVLTNFYENGAIDYVQYEGNDVSLMDAMVVNVTSGEEEKTIALHGGKGFQGEAQKFSINGIDLTMRYGSKNIELPFHLELVDFQLERYPGSNSPSSYASEVILVDERENLREPRRIFMNNVLNYGGYRFFQSSYDKDELGTILSVNHDYWGTLFTYIGYFLMTLGMFLTPFSKYSRFALLGRLLRNSTEKSKTATAVLLVLVTLSGLQLRAQQTHTRITPDQIPAVDADQAKRFGEILIQSHDGRLKPVNTLSSEILRKVARKDKMFGMNPDQVLLGMLSSPLVWQGVPMIKVSNKELQKLIGADDKYASYLDFIDMSQGTYKLNEYVSAAYNKKPAQRNMFDKDVIKVDERLNISYMVYTGDLLKILPDPYDPYKKWYSPASSIKGLAPEDSLFISKVIPTYLQAVAAGENATATELINGISDYQKKAGAEIMPSERKVTMELTYNRMMIFNNLSRFYGLIGFFLLVLVFIEVFRKSKAIKYIIRGLTVLVIVGFLVQTLGLIMRWYISGHAPWSNGYESLIYIGWVTMLAGIIFSRRSNMTLAATTVLTSIILMVAHLSWMDPEITNLVPVLKSYWLTIHVSIITASYGFLALGMLLGFINLMLMIFKNQKNHQKIELKIKDLTAINERTLMIGLYMLTVGTFLGGIWANESWGRYWGWDPKETWALVSVLVYSFILHMQYIPGLRNNYSFNFASLIGYSSILMTYFGVNYYLSGLHSYAAGDPVPIPTFVYYTLAIVALVSIIAYMNNLRFKDKKVSVS